VEDELRRNTVRGVARTMTRIGIGIEIERKERSARRIENEKDTNGGVIVIEIEIVVGAVILIMIVGPTVPIDPNLDLNPKMRSQLRVQERKESRTTMIVKVIVIVIVEEMKEEAAEIEEMEIHLLVLELVNKIMGPIVETEFETVGNEVIPSQDHGVQVQVVADLGVVEAGVDLAMGKEMGMLIIARLIGGIEATIREAGVEATVGNTIVALEV